MYFSKENAEKETDIFLDSLGDAVDSPRSLLIIRNAISTVLVFSKKKFSAHDVYRMLSDDVFRENVLSFLQSETPAYLDDRWRASWSKDLYPLLSENQERIFAINSLMNFWRNEWETLPADIRNHVVGILKKVIKA